MNKKFLFSLCCASLMMLGTSCSDNPSDTGSGEGGSESIVINTADAQKELDRVGKELLQNINLEKVKPVVELTDFCMQEFPEFKNGVNEAIDVLPISFIAKHTNNVLNGDLTTIATKDFVRSMYHYSEIFRTFIWEDGEWIEQANDENFEILFSHEGKSCRVVIEGTGNEINIDDQTFIPDNGLDKTITVPQIITAKVYEDNNLLINITVDTKKFENKNYQIDMGLDVMNYYIASGTMISNSSTADIIAALKVENKTLLSAQLQAKGNNLADYDDIINGSMNYNDINSVSMNLNILNSVQLKAETKNLKKLVDSLEYNGGYYKYSVEKNGVDSIIYASEQTKEEAKANALKAAQVATNNIKAALYFKDSKYSAPVKWDVYYNEYYNYSYNYFGETYHEESGAWEIEPVIIFNESSYTLGTFFTESRFQSLIDSFNDLCNEAEEIYSK